MKASAKSHTRMFPLKLLSPTWRLVTAALAATSVATLPTYVLAVFLLPPVPPIVMIRSFVVGTALPAVMAWAIGRGFAGTYANVPELEMATCGMKVFALVRRRAICMTPDKTATGVPVTSKRAGSKGTAISVLA